MEICAITRLYKTLWKVSPAIELIVIKYKRFTPQYFILAIYNQYGNMEKGDSNIETNFILQ